MPGQAGFVLRGRGDSEERGTGLDRPIRRRAPTSCGSTVWGPTLAGNPQLAQLRMLQVMANAKGAKTIVPGKAKPEG